LLGEAKREAGSDGASPYPELRPPMVCVKLPRSVLVVFHLFRATKLPFFAGIEVEIGLITLNRVSSWRSVVRFPCWTRQPPIGACLLVLTAHYARYASDPRGTSTPNLPTGSSPKGEHGRAPLQSRKGFKIFWCLSLNVLLQADGPGDRPTVPPKPGFGAEPRVDGFFGSVSRHF
jgi:hypothetical protein